MARSSLKNVCRLINDVQSTMPPEKSFLADLQRSIELTDEKGRALPSKTYKPSGMKCMRAMYYQITGVEPDKGTSTYQLVGICNSGTDTHERIQTAITQMKDNGFDCEYINVAEYVKSRNIECLEIKEQKGMETKLYHKDLNISFMCDGIIRYKGHYYILELKTENLNKWGSRKDVNPEHHNQGIAYSLSLGIDDVIFVYICRDNLAMKSFMFNVTSDMKNELVAKIMECDDYVVRKEVPPVVVDTRACTYCNYKSTCNKEV